MSNGQATPSSESTFIRTVRDSLQIDEGAKRSWELFLREISEERKLPDNAPDPEPAGSDAQNVSADARKEIFCQKAEALGIFVHRAESDDETADIIFTIAQSREPEFGQTRQIITHSHPLLLRLRLWQKFAGTDISLHTTFTEDGQLREKTVASYIGVTAAHFGIADCAALFQPTLKGQPRSTSLVPSIHIALLEKKMIVENLQQAYTLMRDQYLNHSSFTLISGASKTADIEATMVHGAHGPRELHVIIIE